MDGGRDVYSPVVYSYSCPGHYWTHTTYDPGWGFTSPIYYLPDNALDNRVRYWLLVADPRLLNIGIDDVRMGK